MNSLKNVNVFVAAAVPYWTVHSPCICILVSTKTLRKKVCLIFQKCEIDVKTCLDAMEYLQNLI